MITRRTRTTTTTKPTRSRTCFSQSEKTLLVTKPSMNSGSELYGYPSLKDVLPAESPPPICSSSGDTTPLSPALSRSPMSDKFDSPTKLSSYTAWNGKKDPRVEVGDHTHDDHANRFGTLSLSDMKHSYSQGAEIKSNIQQESNGQPIISQKGSPESLSHKLMTRPKPYSSFLADVDKHEFEAKIEAWKRAKEEAIMDKLERKEADVSDWEFRHISKAKEEMINFERKLEKRRAKALEKLQKRIRTTKSKANKKIRKATQLTQEKLSEISKLSIMARATKDLSSLKL